MPNVLILMADEHNAYVSSVYGHPFVKTPNMERLAAMGTVFENAYCPSPLCMPSRSAFMTGRPVHEINTFNNCKVIQQDYPSYGGVLAEQGIHTVYVGNGASLFRPPTEHGFSETLAVGDHDVSLDTWFRRRPLPIRGPEVLNRGYGPKDDAFAEDRIKVDQAIDWLMHTAPSVQGSWTLTVNVRLPHFPLYAEPEYWAMYEGYDDLPEYGRDLPPAEHPYARDLRAHFRLDEMSEEQVRGMRRGYYACVSFVDHELGRLLDALEATGQMNETVIAYTADHGEMLGKFGLWYKSILYEDAAKVPLIVAGPGFPKGARVDTPVSLLDLQASIFEAVGRRRPNGWWGEPLQRIVSPEYSKGSERVVFSEYHGFGVRSSSFMIRKGDWKLIYNMEAPHQLFNLRVDPHELENLWGQEPEVASDLENELRSICSPEEITEKSWKFEERQLAAIEQILSKKEESLADGLSR